MDKLHTTFKNRVVAKQLHYGLDKNEVVDAEWFWNEVYLRAANNYNEWHNRLEAEARVNASLFEVCRDAKWSDRRIVRLSQLNLNKQAEIADRMMEGL